MGGFGSGRRAWYTSKTTVEDCLSLDACWMAREGMFDGDGVRWGSLRWTSGLTGHQNTIGYELDMAERWMRLHYRNRGEDSLIDYRVRLTATELPWGSWRWWFMCPLSRRGAWCGRRVAKLRLPPGGRYFGCRQCYDLTYTSCQESGKYAAMWAHLGACVGMRPGDVERLLEADARSEEQWLHDAERRKQRRRRRRARGWK